MISLTSHSLNVLTAQQGLVDLLQPFELLMDGIQVTSYTQDRQTQLFLFTRWHRGEQYGILWNERLTK